MDIDSIVDAVTKEVMKRLKNKMNDEVNSYVNLVSRVLVLGKHDNTDFKTIEQKLKFIGYKVDYMEDKKDIKEYDRIIITSLDNRDLGNIALGVQCGEKESIILESLLCGKKVFLFEDGIVYRKYIKTANKSLFKLYQEYEKKLYQYGISILNKDNFIEEFNKGIVNDNKEDVSELVNQTNISKAENDKNSCEINKDNDFDNGRILELTNKKLLTESDIKKAYEGGYTEINISNKAIVTSLAVDCIRINRIKVNKIA